MIAGRIIDIKLKLYKTPVAESRPMSANGT